MSGERIGRVQTSESNSIPTTLTLEQVSDRLDRLPTSLFHAKVLVIAASSLLFDTLDIVVTGFVLSNLRTIWRFNVNVIGVISAIGLVGFLVGTFFSGFVADRIGRKKTILFTLILYSLFSAARGFSNDVTTLGVLNFFAFIFIGAESSAVPPYLAELWPSRVRGKLNGWMMGFFGLGKALSPIWVLLIIPTLGWRWAFFLTAPGALFAGLMRSGLPESPRWLIKRGRTFEAESVLTWIEGKVERYTRAPLPQTVPRAPLSQSITAQVVRPRDLLGPSYRRITLMLWAAWFAEYGVLYAFQTFVPTILSAEGYPIVKSFQYSLAIYSAVVPAYIFGGRVVEWIDRKYTVLLSFAAAMLFGTLFGLSSVPWEIMLFGGLTDFSLALGSTAIYTYTPELYPTEVRATGMGIASAWGRLGAVIVLLTFGFFFDAQGKSLLFIISDSILLVASVVIVRIGPSTRGRRLEDTSGEISIDSPRSLPRESSI